LAHQFIVTIAICGDGHGIECGEVKDKSSIALVELAGVALFEDGAKADAVEIFRKWRSTAS
jgi:hypothetical protein